MFPSVRLKKEDVVSSWAGLRPLIHEDGKAPSELSRKDEIFISQSGLISIAGGKLTGYRKMSERILKEIKKKNDIYRLSQPIGPSKTKAIKVSGNPFDSEKAMTDFLENLCNQYPDHKKEVRRLFFRYGSNTQTILEETLHRMNTLQVPFAEAIQFAEVKYGIEEEMVHTLSDFAIRRTGMLYFEPHRLQDSLESIAANMQEVCGWSEEKMAEEIQLVRLAYQTVLDFEE